MARDRSRIVLQTEAAECGLACLAIVAGAHGLDIDLPTLRSRFGTSARGVTLADLIRIAGELGFDARALRAEPAHLPGLALPCVLHWDLDHFVVLARVRRGVAVVHDPARGTRRLPLDELPGHFSGHALELSPRADFVAGRERQDLGLRRLLGPVTGFGAALAQVFGLAVALEGFALLAPFFLQWVVDDVLPGADRTWLATLGLGFGLLVLVEVATGALRSWTVLRLSATLNRQWVGNVFAHLLRLPVAWFERRGAGDVLSRFGAVRQIQQTLTTSFVEAVLDGLLVVVTFGVMLAYSARLAAVAGAAVAAYAVLRGAFLRPLRDAAETATMLEARRGGHLLESVRGVLAIKLFDRGGERQARFRALTDGAIDAQFAVHRLELAFAVLHKLLFGLERIAVVWLGAMLVIDARLSTGMLFAFLAYREQFALRVGALIDKAVDLRMLGLQSARLADIVLSEPEPDAARAPVPVLETPVLELTGVRFAYGPGEDEVLAGVDLVVAPGESVAIVGASGCGKTTLLKLMLGVHPPTAGRMRIDGVPPERFGLAAWRGMVGTVMQDDALFAGSVAENISFFDPRADPTWIAECARLASVATDIEALPMRYHTRIGDLGSNLSGGQRQRLLLARALYKRPRFLFLDEATSALDLERERAVDDAVRALALTRIVVAHRLETIASADRVLVLRDGRLVEDAAGAARPTLEPC